jgi:zinc/manganese transport system permease protein
MEPVFSWNLLADLRDMWSLPFMVNAFRAGTIVAVLAALVGWFMVLRKQSFAGHALALVGFPGAAGAVLLGLSAGTGYFVFCLLAAVAIALLPQRGGRGYSDESAVIGTVQAFALAAGLLFVSLYHGSLSGTGALLFGTFLGITGSQVRLLALVSAVVLVALAVLGRPLLSSSIEGEVARANGVPTRALGVLFLLLLGVTTAEVSQITGALLVFALLVLPPATAQLVTARPVTSLLWSVVFGLITVWVSLFIGYYSPYPIGFWLTTVAFGGYLLAAAGRALWERRPAVAGRPVEVPA